MGGEGARGVRGGRLREVVERVEEPRGCGVEVAVGGGRPSGARWRGRGGGWGEGEAGGWLVWGLGAGGELRAASCGGGARREATGETRWARAAAVNGATGRGAAGTAELGYWA